MNQLKIAMEYIEDNRDKINKTYRNKYHLMGPVGWINDPNGFIYFQGEYHLFYQYYPYDSIWGPMHWGHAKSKDLITWEELPIALAPSEDYDIDGCFSGTALVVEDKLYLYYTGHVENEKERREVQCIAVSNDGVTFEKYANNPVISEKQIEGIASIEDFRDPKVFKRGADYYMLVASKTNSGHGQILMFKSENLFDWEFNSVLLEGRNDQGIMWECPDIFQIDNKDVLIMSPIEMNSQGNSYQNRSSTAAFIGNINWETGKFNVDNFHEIDGGLDFYAPQTTLGPDNERVMVAWMQMWDRNMPTNDLNHGWAGSMTLPRELYLENNYLKQRPISIGTDILELQGEITKTIKNEEIVLTDVFSKASYLKIKFDVNKVDKWALRLGSKKREFFEITFEKNTSLLSVSRENVNFHLIKGVENPILNKRCTSIDVNEGIVELKIFKDTSSIEVFTHDGKSMTTTYFEEEFSYDLGLIAVGELVIEDLKVYNINIEGVE